MLSNDLKSLDHVLYSKDCLFNNKKFMKIFRLICKNMKFELDVEKYIPLYHVLFL